jgi:aspartate ammonia-lyase
MATITADYLGTVQLFDKLSCEMRETLVPLFHLETISQGAFLFHQEQSNDAMYLILEGELDIIDFSLGWEKAVVTAGPGTILGESLLLHKGTHSLGGRATCCDLVVAVLTVEDVKLIENDHHNIYVALLRSVGQLMARRLANASRGDKGLSFASVALQDSRLEHDLLGERYVPKNALWGIQTLRAVENFSISNIRLDHFPELIEAHAHIKRACALTNFELEDLDEARCNVIVEACDELLRGMWHGHFVVDMVQGGAGTSTNMNANEVIANRALELLGRSKADYDFLHPNTHVNMSQSTNDVYPSAIKIALLVSIEQLLEEVRLLADSFYAKGEEFSHVLKMGRTQLQDAVPMSLGQEFNAWATIIREGGERIDATLQGIRELNMGGTAIGTGINTDPRYAPLVLKHLRESTGMDLHIAEDLVEATQDTSSFVELASMFKMLGVRLSKVCNDLRLLSSGPRCGLNEINLPAVQPGSSIMPGKVNPVIPEVVNQVAFQVIGLDTSVALCSEGGQLELNVFEPLIAYNLFTSIRMLNNAMSTLRLRCIEGITANEEHCRQMVYNSIGIVTALNPILGYEKTSKVAKTALRTNRPVREVVLEFGFMTEEEVDKALDPMRMLRPFLD